MSPRLAGQVATVLGIGHLPGAPGTWGSLAAIPLAWGLHAAGGAVALVGATLLVAVLGWRATAAYLGGRDEDPPEIVVDEVVGMMIALWPLSIGITVAAAREGATVDPAAFPWPGWVLGFLLFRFFDILKPPPVSWAERMGGAAGVMLDDVVAGALTAAVALLAAAAAHGWF